MSSQQHPIIIGLCNPLLDISAEVPDAVLDKYKLLPNNAILASEEHLPLYDDLHTNFRVEYTAGGAGQNTIRVAQWLLQRPHATAYFGAVGRDNYAAVMTEQATADGVNVRYYDAGGLPTGTCGVLITKNGAARSLVANLSAANTYKVDHLKEKAQWDLVEAARIFYITGFFLTVSPDSILEIGKHACDTGKTFCMNLSAPFLIQVPPFFEAMKRAMPYVDVYFGNESEALALSIAMDWKTTNIREIALKLAQSTEKKSPRPRTVVITQGSDPTIVAIADAYRVWNIEEYPVIPCPKHDLVDTNGAGDAFVGGFLAGMANGEPIVECVARANYAANVVIRRSGATFPKEPDFKFRGRHLTV